VAIYNNTKEGQNPCKSGRKIGTKQQKKMGQLKVLGIVTSYFEGILCTGQIFISLHQSFLLGWMKILIRVH